MMLQVRSRGTCPVLVYGRGREGNRGIGAGKRRTQAHAVAPVASPSSRTTFTNPDGQIIVPLRADVWIVDRPFVWNSIDVGGRMTVIRVTGGGLWVHSPVELDSTLSRELESLGPVKHIVSPNYEHLKYAQQWIEAFPEATAYACPGLIEKHPEIAFDCTVAEGDTVPSGWPEEIDVTHLSHEANPFTGTPFFNEVIFCHRPSRSLISADFFWNYPSGQLPWRTRLWKGGMDKLFRPFYFNLMIRDRDAYERSMKRVFGQEWDAIIPCHGAVVTEDAKATLSDFTQWPLSSVR